MRRASLIAALVVANVVNALILAALMMRVPETKAPEPKAPEALRFGRTILEMVPESVEVKKGLPAVIRGGGRVVVDTHGADDGTILCRQKWVHPHYVLAALLGEGLIKEGEEVTFVCCFPGLKTPGDYRGVRFRFCSDAKTVIFATMPPRPGHLYRVYY